MSDFGRRLPKINIEGTQMRFSSVKGMSVIAAAMLAAGFSTSAMSAVDAEAAKELARNNKCFDCHAVDKDGDGPSLKKIAAKFKGKPEAETEKKLIHHITSGEKAKFADGHEEEHKIVRTKPSKDMVQIKNLVYWVLSH